MDFKDISNRLKRTTSNNVYFPEIDGIRFFAISLVILFHLYGFFYARFSPDIIVKGKEYFWLNTIIVNGDRGVQLFFVLSGFILCMPFATSYLRKGGEINIKRYYLRRLTRLEPPYIIAMSVLFLSLVATHAYTFEKLFPSFLASIFYLHGIIYQTTPLVSVVAWSLEVEIQFYLVAPILFLIMKLQPRVRRGILISSTIIIILLQHTFIPGFARLINQLQYFLVGILLADFYVSNTARSFFSARWIPLYSLMSAIVILLLPIKDNIYAQLIFPFVILFFYYSILVNVTMKRIFSYSFIPVIGGMCYSLYLIHYPLISLAGRNTAAIRVTEQYIPNMIVQFSLATVLILFGGTVFYFFVEKPFMSNKWIDKLMNRNKIGSIG